MRFIKGKKWSALLVFLFLMVLFPVSAAPDTGNGIDVEVSKDGTSVRLTAGSGIFGDEDVSVVCYSEQWNGNPADMAANASAVCYMDQRGMSSAGGTWILPLPAAENGIYSLVLGAESLKEPIVRQFSVGVDAISVSLDANGGNVSNNALMVKPGSSVTLPVPNRTNYWFDGWYTAKEGGTAVNAATTFDADTVLYAHWSAFTLERWGDYYSTSGWETAALGDGCAERPVIEFDLVPLENSQDGGIYFTGKTTELSDWGHAPIALRLYTDGCFEARNGGSYARKEEIHYQKGSRYHFKIMAELDELVYSAYVTGPDGNTQTLADNYAFRTGAKSISDIGKLCARGGSNVPGDKYFLSGMKLYPNPEKKYTVTLKPEGGSVSPQKLTVIEGKTLNLPEPKRIGYLFKGWYTSQTGGTEVTEATAISQDMELYARWEEETVIEPEKEYTIILNPEGGTVSPEKLTVEEGGTLELPVPKRTGYTFKGWYTLKIGGTKITADMAVSQDMELHARWEKNKPANTTLKKGAVFTVKKLKYKVIVPAKSNKAGTVSLIKYSGKAQKLKIADTVNAPSKKGKYKITKIAANACKGNKKLKSVTVGNNVTSIEANAFRGNINLKSVVIGKNVSSIRKNAFYGCKKLEKITIKSAKLKKIESKVLKGIKKKAVIKVPAKKLKAYKKLFKSKTGYQKTMKVKTDAR